MTAPLDPVKLLALAVYQLGGSLEITTQLLDSMNPVRLVLDNQTDTGIIRLSILSNETLVGVLDDGIVNVSDLKGFTQYHWFSPDEEAGLTLPE